MGAGAAHDRDPGPCAPIGAPGPGVAHLTSAIARGDNSALEEFYRAWFDRCYAMARGITRRDESFCLDVVQEAMLRVVKKMPVLDDDGQLERWMKRVVHTAALDLLKAERRRVARESGRARPESVGTGGPNGADLAERIAWVREQLDALEGEERALLIVRVGEGRTLEEAGAGAGISGDAAHGRVRRLLKKLRAAAKGVFGE